MEIQLNLLGPNNSVTKNNCIKAQGRTYFKLLIRTFTKT